MPYLNKTTSGEPFSLSARTQPPHSVTRFLYPVDLSAFLAKCLQAGSHGRNLDEQRSLPAISVAMSVYNAEQFLASAINSILTQNFSDNWYLEDNLTFLQQIGLVP
jgi:hypothetical protein